MTPDEMDHYWERFFAARSDAALAALARELAERFPGDPGALTLGGMIAMATTTIGERPRQSRAIPDVDRS